MHKFTKDQQIIISYHKFNFVRMYYYNLKYPNSKGYDNSDRKFINHVVFSKKLC